MARRFDQWCRSRDRVAEAAALAVGQDRTGWPNTTPTRLRRLWHEILRGRIPLP